MYNPGSVKYLSYQIYNPQDLGTLYYIQVVVRYSNGLGVIATVNLKSQGNGLYTGSYQIPQADASGLNGNFDVFETLTVYTDSAYSQLSPNYSIVNTPVSAGFIATNASSLNGGSGSFDLTDYPFIRKLIKEELAVFLEMIPKQKEVKFSTANLEILLHELSGQLNDHKGFLANELKGHREDMARGFEGMNNNILEEILNLDIPKYPFENLEAGLKEVNKNLKSVDDTRKQFVSETLDGHTEIAKKIMELEGTYNKGLQEIKESILEELYSKFQKVETLSPKEIKKVEPEQTPTTDYFKLAGGFIRQRKNA